MNCRGKTSIFSSTAKVQKNSNTKIKSDKFEHAIEVYQIQKQEPLHGYNLLSLSTFMRQREALTKHGIFFKPNILLFKKIKKLMCRVESHQLFFHTGTYNRIEKLKTNRKTPFFKRHVHTGRILIFYSHNCILHITTLKLFHLFNMLLAIYSLLLF